RPAARDGPCLKSQRAAIWRSCCVGKQRRNRMQVGRIEYSDTGKPVRTKIAGDQQICFPRTENQIISTPTTWNLSCAVCVIDCELAAEVRRRTDPKGTAVGGKTSP